MIDSHQVRKHRRRRTHSKKRQREQKRQQFFRAYGLQGCLILVLASLIPAWFVMTRDAPRPPLPPQDILRSQVHLADLKKLLQRVRLDGELDKAHPFDYRLSARDLEVGLTTEGDAMDSLRAKAIEVLSVKILEGKVEVTATAPQLGSEAEARVMLEPVVSNGSLKFRPAENGTGKDGTPEEVLAQDVGNSLEQLVSVSTVKYRSARIDGSNIVLSGNSAARRY